jgi:hypothetical protein
MFERFKINILIITAYYAIGELASGSCQSFRQLGLWILIFSRYPASVLISANNINEETEKNLR